MTPWQHQLSKLQLELASAALRHTSDARALLSTSPVQAAYLAGYGPECARKAALSREEPEDKDLRNKAIGHRFDKNAELTFNLFCDIDPLATRYELRNWKALKPAITEWKEELRYARSDSLNKKRAEKLVEASRDLTETTLAALWADGRLEPLAELIGVKP